MLAGDDEERKRQEELAAREAAGEVTREIGEEATEMDANGRPVSALANPNPVDMDFTEHPVGAPSILTGARKPVPDDLYKGALAPGNIDLAHRPKVKNEDGSVSSVRSIGVNLGDGETLIPTVSPDGKILSDDDAVELYKTSGQHLGKYKTVEESNAAAQRIHEQQANLDQNPVATPSPWHAIAGDAPKPNGIETPDARGVVPEKAPPGMFSSFLQLAKDPDLSPKDRELAAKRYNEQKTSEATKGASPGGPDMGSTWKAFAERGAFHDGGDVHSMGTASDDSAGDGERRSSGGSGDDDGGSPWGALAAIGLDLFGNRGRGLGGIAAGMSKANDPYEREKRSLEMEKLRAEIVDIRSGRRRGDPGTLALREAELQLRYKQLEQTIKNQDENRGMRATDLGIKQGGLDVRKRTQDRNLNPNNPQSLAENESLADLGVPMDIINRLDHEGKKMMYSLLKQDATTRPGAPLAVQDIDHKADVAGAISKTTLPDRKEIAGIHAGLNQEKFDQGKKDKEAEQANTYARETERYRDIAEQAQKIYGIMERHTDGIPGTGFIKGKLPDLWYAATDDNDALSIRNAKRLMNETVVHAQTGAAAPIVEENRLRLITGAKDNATVEEFKIGLDAMRDYARGHLRAYSAGKEKAARNVLKTQGIDRMVFDDDELAPEDDSSGDDATGETGDALPPPGDELQTTSSLPPKSRTTKKLKQFEDEDGITYE